MVSTGTTMILMLELEETPTKDEEEGAEDGPGKVATQMSWPHQVMTFQHSWPPSTIINNVWTLTNVRWHISVELALFHWQCRISFPHSILQEIKKCLLNCVWCRTETSFSFFRKAVMSSVDVLNTIDNAQTWIQSIIKWIFTFDWACMEWGLEWCLSPLVAASTCAGPVSNGTGDWTPG